MSHEFRRRGKNWFTAMGVLFIIMALIVIGRNLILWGPEFVLDFFLNSEITNEKVSLGMLAFGSFMIILGFRKKHD
ncbi:MAG: hypothetical protein O6746_00870 [Thaumarchaeota archaeon]|jgi:hypothetical protein|nr:hypothetical protein [Nitrososphaerota archaeon]